MKRTRKTDDLNSQIKETAKKKPKKKKKLEGNIKMMTSTGSTLFNLAICGGRVRGGGLPCQIMVEIFGPESMGKTVLLSEIAGYVQRNGGEALFNDTESRFNEQFAKIFDYDLNPNNYHTPDTVTQVFTSIRKWKPKNLNVVNGIFTDSLAALSTNLEMDSEDGDKMGMRRGKEFSEGFRKNARLLVKNNYLMVCSNQIRDTTNTIGPKTEPPGGKAIKFYSSVRARITKPLKDHLITKKIKVNGKDVTEVIGINIIIDIVKNSTWKPFRSAPVTIIFDYGIDDIRQNLMYIKKFSPYSTYTVNGKNVGKSINNAIDYVEKHNLEEELQEQVIDLWEEIQKKFDSNRKKKKR